MPEALRGKGRHPKPAACNCRNPSTVIVFMPCVKRLDIAQFYQSRHTIVLIKVAWR